MADLCGDREGSANVTELSCSSGGGGGGNGRSETATPHQLMVSGSFKGDGKGPRRRMPIRPSLDADEFINLLHGSDPVKVELNRLENEVRGGNVVRSDGVLVSLSLFCSSFMSK